MPAEIPTNNPEKKVSVDDNDRKFIVGTLDDNFLAKYDATSYYLVTDWLETNEDDETKIVRKTFENGDEQLLYIAKVMINGERKAEKVPISEERYQELLNPLLPHVEKTRYELVYEKYKVKYDVFTDSTLRVLEVDADSADERKLFDPNDFPYPLQEVSEDERYRGYRVAKMV